MVLGPGALSLSSRQLPNRVRTRTILMAIGVLMAALSVSGQTIVVESPTADVGTVQRGTPIMKEFVVKNTGSGPLRIADVKPACGCMQAKFDKTIPPGGTGKIVLTIDTKSFRSAISKTAVVTSNDSTTPELTLIVVANVRGVIRGEPSDSVRIQTTKGQLGAAETSLTSENPAFKPTAATTNQPYLRAVLLPESQSGRWKVMVTSDATAPVGPLAGMVTVSTGIPEEPEFRIPVTGIVTAAGQTGTGTITEAGMTNEEVVKLVAADLGDEIVIAKIKNSAVARLDVSTDALVALKDKKVSKTVITAMIERAGQPNKTPTASTPPASSATQGASSAGGPCAGIELMGLYKNEIFDRAMGGGVVEWLAKIRNNTGVTKIVVFGWRDSEGQTRKSQVQIAGGQIASPRVDMTQARYIAPVANLQLVSCE